MRQPLRHIFILTIICFNSIYGQISPTTTFTLDSTTTIKSQDSINEVPPKFLDGDLTQMNKFLIDNLKYPDAAKEQGLTGTCFVKFSINTDGKVTDIIILKGVPGCYECDREVIRVINLMPKWTPALKNGTPVKTYITTSLKFKMQ